MKTVKELKEYLEANRGKTNSYEGFTIQVYDGNALQAQIQRKGISVVKIEQRGENGLNFFLQREECLKDIDYGPRSYIKDDESLVKIMEEFKDHVNVEYVIAALMLLHEDKE